MKTIVAPSIITVAGYLLRNDCIVPDDGGTGEVIEQALCLPDGKLLPANRKVEDVRLHIHTREWGVIRGEPKDVPLGRASYKAIQFETPTRPAMWVQVLCLTTYELHRHENQD